MADHRAKSPVYVGGFSSSVYSYDHYSACPFYRSSSKVRWRGDSNSGAQIGKILETFLLWFQLSTGKNGKEGIEKLLLIDFLLFHNLDGRKGKANRISNISVGVALIIGCILTE